MQFRRVNHDQVAGRVYQPGLEQRAYLYRIIREKRRQPLNEMFQNGNQNVGKLEK
jgi:hypothetical protein